MRTLLHFLGTPQASFTTILVAGTKGKGSVAALLTSILDAAGYRVGRYTQPHLYSYRERTWACGDYISEEELEAELEAMEEALDLVEDFRDELGPLTTFDVGTALTLLHFAHTRVQLAVVEVGVGGANDATNVLEPALALIGPVGLDHVEVLGHSLRDVALHKVGVSRRGIHVVVGRQETEALEAVREGTAARGAYLRELGAHFDWVADDPCSGPFDARGPLVELEGLETPLIGQFQRDNAVMAVAAAQLLDCEGWPVSQRAIRDGLAAVQWPGRFQTVVTDPLTILDGAHNPTSGKALAATVRDYLRGKPVTLVLGMSRTKDLEATLAELAPVAEHAVITRASHPRGCDPDQLAEAARGVGLDATIVPSPADAVRAAWDRVAPGGATLVTGSLFLVGDVLEWLWQAQRTG